VELVELLFVCASCFWFCVLKVCALYFVRGSIDEIFDDWFERNFRIFRIVPHLCTIYFRSDFFFWSCSCRHFVTRDQDRILVPRKQRRIHQFLYQAYNRGLSCRGQSVYFCHLGHIWWWNGCGLSSVFSGPEGSGIFTVRYGDTDLVSGGGNFGYNDIYSFVAPTPSPTSSPTSSPSPSTTSSPTSSPTSILDYCSEVLEILPSSAPSSFPSLSPTYNNYQNWFSCSPDIRTKLSISWWVSECFVFLVVELKLRFSIDFDFDSFDSNHLKILFQNARIGFWMNQNNIQNQSNQSIAGKQPDNIFCLRGACLARIILNRAGTEWI